MALDYKDFLKPAEPVVLPYFGGTRVDTADRRLRIEHTDEADNLAPGWWRFRIDGRRAVPLEPAATLDLSPLPAVRGHFVSGWIVVDGRQLHRIALPPADEPAPLSRVLGRRWYSGDVLFDTVEFEDDVELSARDALEHRRELGNAKGVVPSLRAAFGCAFGLAVAADLNITATPPELVRHAVAIADGGRQVVEHLFEEILYQRRQEEMAALRRLEEAQRAQQVADASRTARPIRRDRDPVRRADDALEQAGARMLSARRLASGTQLDVSYEVDGTRILTLVDSETLQVLDPGICLSNAHRVLTLDAMPSVVREAIEEEHLNITRRP